MRYRFLVLFLLFAYSLFAWAQQPRPTHSPRQAPRTSTSNGSGSEDSSSRETLTDLNSPDTRDHSEATDEIEEAHTFNPYRAMKDIEVADFYYKRGNYRASLERYKEALEFKENDAEATFGVARCEEKLGNSATARSHYEAYLKILPQGPRAKDARKALQRLPQSQAKAPNSSAQNAISSHP